MNTKAFVVSICLAFLLHDVVQGANDTGTPPPAEASKEKIEISGSPPPPTTRKRARTLLGGPSSTEVELTENGVKYRYDLSKKIGEGGFGKVYRGYERNDTHILEDIAVKISSLRRNYRLEKGVYEKVGKHENIPIMLFTNDDKYAIGMELFGLDMDEVLKTTGAFPSATVLGTALELMAPLKKLHAEKIIHGDIKLKNVATAKPIDPKRSRVILFDFNASQLDDSDGEKTEKDDFQGVLKVLYQMSRGPGTGEITLTTKIPDNCPNRAVLQSFQDGIKNKLSHDDLTKIFQTAFDNDKTTNKKIFVWDTEPHLTNLKKVMKTRGIYVE